MRMAVVCFSTAESEMKRVSEMAEFDLPWASCCRISRFRSVRSSSPDLESVVR